MHRLIHVDLVSPIDRPVCAVKPRGFCRVEEINVSGRNRFLMTAVLILGLSELRGARGDDPPLTFVRELRPRRAGSSPSSAPTGRKSA